MKPGLLERIQAVGYWRVVLRPIVPLAERLSFQQCGEEVSRARVSLRGWDYPHLSHRQDDQGGAERGEDFLENWCDWHSQVEFWRMYRSGQFLSYNALDDDTDGDADPNNRHLNIVGTIYSVTEVIEFAHRLAANGLYRDGYSLNLSLHNTCGRYLDAGRGRMPFLDFQRSNAESIYIERRVEPDTVEQGAVSTSTSVLLELFDAFGWNPDQNQIRADQEAFYRREFR